MFCHCMMFLRDKFDDWNYECEWIILRLMAIVVGACRDAERCDVWTCDIEPIDSYVCSSMYRIDLLLPWPLVVRSFFFLSKWQPANVFVHLYPIGCHLDILLRSTFSSFPMPNANPDNKLSCVDPIVSALFITLYFSVFVLSAIATTKWHMIMECVSFIHIRICLISISGGNFALETHWNDETQLKLRFSRIDRFLLCILMLSTRQQRFSRPHCLRTTYIYI